MSLALLGAVALALGRLLPEDGLGLWLRLAGATLLLLAPGALLARAVGRGGAAGTLVFSLVALGGALGVVFVLHTGLGVALWVLLAIAVGAFFAARRRGPELHPPGFGLVLLLGTLFGILLWHVAGPPEGDALFHLARVRKLDELGDLSLYRVVEFRDGGLHPGYAMPLWHGLLALVARLAGIDPTLVVEQEASVLVPLSFLVVFEAGTALFRSAWLGGAVLAGQVALAGLAAGSGGSFRSLALPGSAGGRLLLAPAALALLFTYVRSPSTRGLVSLAAAGFVLALVHPTYAVFVCFVAGGFLAARALLVRGDVPRLAAGLAAFSVPVGLVLLRLLPIVRDTASHNLSRAELLGGRHGIARYPGQIDVFSADRYRLAPEVISRGGAVAVAALCLVPLAGLAARRRWAAFVLGGSLLLLGILLTPFVFPHFVDAVSLSQARRAAAFLPLPFAFAGGAAVLAGLLGPLVAPVGFVAGIVLQLAFPGDFGYRLEHGGPALAVWIATVGGAAALAAGAVVRGRRPLDRPGAAAFLAAALFVVSVGVHGFSRWDPPRIDRKAELSPGLLTELRRDVRPGSVVFSDPETSYRLAAYLPVYVASSSPTHVADTRKNRPYERAANARRFFRSVDLGLVRQTGARWLVIDFIRTRPRLFLAPVWTDGRFAIYAV